MQKKYLFKKLALALALSLAVPTTIAYSNPVVVEAATATPTMNVKSKTIIGIGKSYKLSVKNAAKGSKFSWSSSKKSVATVSSTGTVTAKAKGTATITCKITLPNKKTKTVTSKITVKVPASAVMINNTDLQNNAHTIMLGSTYDFNRTIVPKASSDKTYWSIDDTSIATVDKNGVVTPLKEGIVVLTATAAESVSKTSESKIKDTVNIRIVPKTVSVSNVNLLSATKLQIQFTSPMLANTLIGDKDQVKNVVITPLKDEKDKLAAALGDLTAELSTDQKTLTITNTQQFKGNYSISVLSEAKATDNTAVQAYQVNKLLEDKVGPMLTNYVLDDSGYLATMTFNEPIDITNLALVSATGYPSDINTVSLSILKNKNNYTLSADKCSLTISLQTLPVTDQNKQIRLRLTGITDVVGNDSNPYPFEIMVKSDTSTRPQANFYSARRTSMTQITAYFDRAIEKPGVLSFGGSSYNGVVNSENKKQVVYTISSKDSQLTGVQQAFITGYSGYHVANGATTSTVTTINFDVDKTAPVRVGYNTDRETNVLTLTYNEDIILGSTTGTLIARLEETNGNITPGCNITYTASVKDKTVTVTLKADSVAKAGNYSIAIPEGFVLDVFNNPAKSETLLYSKTGSSATQLGAPTSIVQSMDDPSTITVTFPSRLDVTSAQNPANYTFVGGARVQSANIIQQDANSAVVELKMVQGSIADTMIYPMTISNIKGFDGNLDVMEPYTTKISLIENQAPYYMGAAFQSSNRSIIEIKFSEDLVGNPEFTVTQGGNILTNTAFIEGKTVKIVLNQYPPTGNYITIIPTAKNSLGDANKNKAIFSQTIQLY